MRKKTLLAKGVLILAMSPVMTTAAQADTATTAAQAGDMRSRAGQFLIKNKYMGQCLKAGKTKGSRVTLEVCNERDDYQWWTLYQGNKVYSVNGQTGMLCIGNNQFTKMVECIGANSTWIGGVPEDWSYLSDGNCGFLKADLKYNVKCTPGRDGAMSLWRRA
ncbi:RICIN domain-containing protein [Nonomuraea turcica]|uniref:hypothetical protein n=1 Tax=Nonomuraea sp. G32 TaxID=3067274 RepID=UPI00273B755C|nr:hypothetical protein [Nonomuraea sp. G32]MDP4512051.1 hypothetical protein [Nonomuraea sp. G32]